METTTLGRGGPVVSLAGLGLMGMSGVYGRADDAESIATIRAAIDAGITLDDRGGTPSSPCWTASAELVSASRQQPCQPGD